MSAEEMAEMAYTLLVDLGYTSDRDWFNQRLFVAPNNEAFFSVFQYLLSFADPQMFKDKFKFCLPLYDKRREGDFRKVLCSLLQDLARNGDLGDDVPMIKMALFTTPGRSAFLQMLLAVIEWVIRKNSSMLEIVIPPYDAPHEALQSVLEFYGKQMEADAKAADALLGEMQSQMELLVSDLQKTDAAVQASRDELTKAQEQTKTTEGDEKNLRKLSEALSQMASMSRSLRRLLDIVQTDSPSHDALTIIEPLPEVLLQSIPEAGPKVDELNEQISSGQVDILLYMRLVSIILRNRRPLFNDVIEKLSVGSAIDRSLRDQRKCLEQARKTLNQIHQFIDAKSKSITGYVTEELEAVEDALILAIDPPSVSELKELVDLSEANLDSVGENSAPQPRNGAMAPPTARHHLKRKKIGTLNLPLSNTTKMDLSGFSPLSTPIQSLRIDKLKNERLKRRSIKDVFTSTPFVTPQ
ncbi:uncharacterized protein LOC100903785 [Galendromus occidentalis]|uniref:Uncharacterized protein LOC100903785 n=1 Tax=Galendromus occidentalis TaxID=34638 RepID=A0AAJ6VW68_9ACAR|nr:uncharacterized protein LOC100903785 [Galendromus occidentalis]